MTAHAPTATGSSATTSPSRLRLLALEWKYELLKTLRMPAYAIPTIAFPCLFYAFFGLAFGGGRSAGPTSMATYLLATYGTFGVIGTALFGFGVGVAMERGQGWMLLKRASPMPPLAYFAAKMGTALVFAAVLLVCLFALGGAFGGVALPTTTWLALFAVLLAGTLPFCALGLALGYLCGPNSAPAIVNLVYLPASFASGLWVPIQALPDWLQGLAPWLPPYHLAQLALGTLGVEPRQPVWVSGVALAAATVVGVAVALWAYRRDTGKTYG